MRKNSYATKFLLTLCTFLFVGNMTFASGIGNYHALFIAIDNYNSKVWSPLNNPVNDANAIKSVLSSKYGFSGVTMLYNEEATRANILETLEHKINELGENDNLVVYFSGHGIEIGEDGYWVPVEAKSQERYELLAISEIKNIVGKANSRHVLVMVDACFSSTILKSPKFAGLDIGSDPYYDQVDQLISRQAITAGGLEPVADGAGNSSIFTKYILKFLNNNQKDVLDAGELYELIKYPVAANSPNTPQFGHLQNTGHEGGQFLFRLNQVKLCDSPVYFEEGEVVDFDKDGGTLHAKTDFRNVKYEWSYNSEILDHEGPDLEIKKSGMYGVTIITEDGDCSNAAISEVTIIMPEVIIDVLEGQNIEFTHKGKLNASISGYSGEMTYEWKKGNFLVGNSYSLEVTESDNYTIVVKLPDGRSLGRKTVLVIIKNRVYTVQLGDNMKRIARSFYDDVTKADVIYKANPEIIEGSVLRVGAELIIPTLGEGNAVQAISIGATKSFAPFCQSNLYNGGMLTDIVNTVYSRMGKRTDISYVPNNQLRGVTFNGRTEVSYPLTMNTNDKMLFLFSEPLYTTLTVFFANKDSEVENMKKTMQKRMRKGKYSKLIVAIPVGFNSDNLMKYYEDKYIVLKPMKSFEDCFKAMKEGRVDLVAAPQITGLVTIQNSAELSRADFKILEKSIESTTLHLVVSKEHPNAEAIIKEFNEVFEAAKAEGEISKVVDTHIDLIQKSRP